MDLKTAEHLGRNKHFKESTRSRYRDILYKELYSVVDRYGQLEPYDKLTVLDLISHKVKEKKL